MNLITLTERDLENTRSSQGNDLVNAVKAFLQSEEFNALPKGSIKGIAVASLLEGQKEAHYYSLKKAVSPTFSKGEKKGKENPDFDKGIASKIAVYFPSKFKTENAKITAFAFKKL